MTDRYVVEKPMPAPMLQKWRQIKVGCSVGLAMEYYTVLYLNGSYRLAESYTSKTFT